MGRSPIMESKLRSLFADRGLSDRVCIESAGIQGTGNTALPRFLTLADYPEGAIMLPMLKKKGIDVSTHIYQPVTEQLIKDAILVLVPSEDIRSVRPNSLAIQFPSYKDKIKLFSELIEKTEDVPDFADSFDERLHRKALEMICTFAEQGFSRLCTIIGLDILN